MTLNIRTKLLLGFGLVLVLAGGLNIYALIKMEHLADLTTRIYNHPLQVTRAVLSAHVGIIKIHREIKSLPLAVTKQDISQIEESINVQSVEIYRQFGIVEKWILGAEGAALMEDTKQLFTDWKPIRDEAIELMLQQQRDAATEIIQGRNTEHAQKLEIRMAELRDYAANKANGMYDSAQITRETVLNHTLIALLMVFIVSGLISFVIARRIAGAVEVIMRLARRLSAGHVTLLEEDRENFEELVKRNDEMGDIGRAIESVARYFQSVIGDIVQISRSLAQGQLNVKPQAEYRGDFQQISVAMTTALSNQQQVIEEIVEVSQNLAAGKLTTQIQARYPGDFCRIEEALKTALPELRAVINDIVEISSALAAGQWQTMPQATYRGEFIRVSKALSSAMQKLAQASQQNLEQDWLKTGQAELSQKLRGEQQITELAKRIIHFLSRYLEAQIGAFYLLDELENPPALKLIASYAYTQRRQVSNRFELGESLVGQAALEKEVILLSEVPDEYVHIQSGLGQIAPKNIIVLPFLYDDEIKGVIEIGSLHAFSAVQREFLAQAMPNIGIAINTAQARKRMQYLLEQAQTQSEELQVQQEELRHSNEILEERSQELLEQKEAIRRSNEMLQESRHSIEEKAKELEQASRYKSEFLANMSHELRTPLNSLLILAKMLADNREQNLSEKQVEWAHTIHSAGSDLLMLINDILDLSKVEAGRFDLNIENCYLRDIVQNTRQKFQHMAQEKGLKFEVKLSSNIQEYIQSDAQRLQQIINNLLSNALKFTDKNGQVSFSIGPAATDLKLSEPNLRTEDLLAFAVKDSGIGIPKDKQALVFEAFRQADGTTSRRYGGTGLGLSISRKLATLLGGDLILRSQPGKGSEFILLLPKAVDAHATNEFIAQIEQDNEPAESASFYIKQDDEGFQSNLSQIAYPKRIQDDRESCTNEDKSLLIIEDDQKFISILMEMARELGFKCLVAEDGKEGLILAGEYRPSAIVLDVGLPELDGLSVMDRLKDNPLTRAIPVHFISASDDSREARRMGAVGYLEKPADAGQLSQALKKLEALSHHPIKNLLIFSENQQQGEKIAELLTIESIHGEIISQLEQAWEHLRSQDLDCLVIAVGQKGQACMALLEKIYAQSTAQHIPILLYSQRELSLAEEKLVHKLGQSLVVKTVRSLDRLLDETMLFLHQFEAKLPQEKRQILARVHNKEAILAGKKILIVDDDPRNIFSLSALLEDKAMEVYTANNGEDCLKQLAAEEDMDIVLMDIMMPGMDGYETIREIRKQAHFRQLPVLALTAKAMKNDRAKCIEAGANDYLPKPVDASKLLSLLRVWLYP